MFCLVHEPKLHNDNDLCACGTPYRVTWPKMWTEESARQDSPLPSGKTGLPHIVSLWAFLSWGNLLPGDGEKTPLGRRHLRGALTGQLTSLGAMGWGEGHSKQRDQNVQMRKQKISQNSGPSIFLQKHKNCLFHLGSDKVQKSLWDFFSVTSFKISFILQ